MLLLLLIFAAILAYIACFVLIRYNLNETAHHRVAIGNGTDSSVISDFFLQQVQFANNFGSTNPDPNVNTNLNVAPTGHAADPSTAESQSGQGQGQGQGHRAGPSTSTERAPPYGTTTSTSTTNTRPHTPFTLFSSTRGPHFLPTVSHSGPTSGTRAPAAGVGTRAGTGVGTGTGTGSLNLPPIITHPSELFQAVQKSLGLGVFVSRVHPFQFSFSLKGLSLVSICTCGRRAGRHRRTRTRTGSGSSGSGGTEGGTGGGSDGGSNPDTDTDADMEMDHRSLMRLLTRCHTACSLFILVGFVLQVTGVLAFVWSSYVRAVSVWGSACVAFVVVVGFVALH